MTTLVASTQETLKDKLLSGISTSVLAAAALVAVNSTAAFAATQDDNTDDGSTALLPAGDNAVFSGAAAGLDELFIVADGVNVGSGGEVIVATTLDGVGTLQNNGTSTMTGTIGAVGNRLGQLLLSQTSGKTATITGNVFAVNTNVNGTGTTAFGGSLTTALAFNADGLVTLANNGNMTGAVSTATNNTGTFTFLGNSTASSTIGASGLALKAINFNGAGSTVNLNGNVFTTAANFGADGTVALANNVNWSGALTTTTTNTGTFNLGGAGTHSVTGQLGASGTVLKSVGITGTGTTTFNNNVFATALNFSADGVANFATGANLTANTTTGTNNTGTLTLAGSHTVTGNVGAGGNALKALNVGANGSTTTITGNVFATNTSITGSGTVNLQGDTTSAVNFAGDGIINLSAGSDITGAVTNTTTNNGTLNAAGASAFSTTLGGSGQVLKAINLNGAATTSTFGGNVFATAFNFGADATASIAAGVNTTTAFATTTTNTGVLTFAGNTTHTGTIGGSGLVLKTINVNGAGTTVSSSGNVFATTTNFGGNGTFSLGNNANLTSAVTTSTTNTGALTFAGNSTVTGNLGVGGTVLNAINLNGAGSTVSLTGDAFATTMNFGGNGTLSMADGSDFTGALTTTTNNTGTITNLGSSVYTGNVGVAGTALTAFNANGASGKTTSVSGNLAATNIGIGGAGTLSVGGNVTGATAFTADGTMSLADGSNHTGAITTNANNQGTLTLAGSTTVSSTIGSSTSLDLKTINLNGGAGKTATFQGNVFANSINFGGNGTMNLADGVNLTGATTTTTANTGALVAAGTSTITGALGVTGTRLASVTLSGGATKTVTFAGDVFTQSFVNSANTNVTATTLGTSINVTNALTAGNTGTGTYNFGVTSNSSNNTKFVMGAGVGAAFTNATFNIVTTSPSTIFNNSQWTIVDGNATSVLPTAAVTDNTGLGSFAVSLANSSQDIVLTYTRATTYAGQAATDGANQNMVNVATALDQIGFSTDTNLNTFRTNLDAAGTAGARNSILESALPQADGSNHEILYASNLMFDQIEGRMNTVRMGTDKVGKPSGDAIQNRGVWVQGFGNTATQDNRQGIAGYDSDTMGVAVGADKEVRPGMRLGISASYASTDVDSNTTTRKNSDIKTYQGNIYGSLDRGNWFTQGIVGFAYNDIETTRDITTVPATAKGDTNGYTYIARAATGYKKTMANGLDVVPNASLTLIGNHTDGYTETGAGGLNLTVDSDNTHALIGKAGVDVGYTAKTGSSYIRPELRAAVMYDVIGDRQESSSFFTGNGGGAVFQTKSADPAQLGFTVGAGLDLLTSGSVTVSADYDYEIRSDYDSQDRKSVV